MVLRIPLTAALVCVMAAPADAQLFRRRDKGAPPVRPAPEGLPPGEAAIWPFPPPDPQSWWDEKRLAASEAADPLGGRRLRRRQQLPAIDNGVDASTYRLWGLMPLQWQVLQDDEVVLEAWVRPARSVRQSVVRVIVRRDGKAFVQGRAGLACCEAGIARRIGFDAELPAGGAEPFRALRGHPMWAAPRDVRLDEGGGLSEALCVDGVSYDVTLLTRAAARTLHRACEDAEVGQAADALEPILRAALGHEPRFDVLFPGGIDFGAARAAYQALIASGGALKADPEARRQPPGAEPAPQEEQEEKEGLLP